MKEVADILLVVIAFLALIFASATDIKKKEVPNWLNFSLLAVALAIRGIAALLLEEASYFYWALIVAAVVYGVASLFYYSRVFGGGDAKLLVALGAVFATTPFFAKISMMNEPFIVTFIINAFFIGAIWGLVTGIYFFIKMPKQKFWQEFNAKNKKLKFVKIASLIVALLSIALVIIFNEPWLIVISVLIFLVPYLQAFINVIENNSFIKLIEPEKLTEGDSLLKEIKIKDKIIKKSVHGLSKEEIELIRKTKMRVWIKEGLIFVPVLLIALIVSLLWGNLLFSIIYGILS